MCRLNPGRAADTFWPQSTSFHTPSFNCHKIIGDGVLVLEQRRRAEAGSNLTKVEPASVRKNKEGMEVMTNAGTPQKARTAQNRFFVVLLVLGSLSGMVKQLERVGTVAQTLHSVVSSFAEAGQRVYVARIASDETFPAQTAVSTARACEVEEVAAMQALDDATVIGGMPVVQHQRKQAAFVPAKKAVRLKLIRLPELQTTAAIIRPEMGLPPGYRSLPNTRLAQEYEFKLPDELLRVGTRIIVREANRFHEKELMHKALKQKIQPRRSGSTSGFEFINFVGALPSGSDSLGCTE